MSKRLTKSTLTVAAMTMLSRIAGFLRDILLAQIFGAAGAFDTFVIAFRIPNFFRRVFGEGAFSQAFVPILASYAETDSKQATRELINYTAGALTAIILFIILLAEIAAPVLVMIFVPGFHDDPHRLHLTEQMLHITFPYLLLISLTAFSGSILNTHHRFAMPAFTPVLLNLSLIAAAWFFAPYAKEPITVLAWGVLAGGVLQLAIQLPYLAKLKLLPIPKLNFSHPGVKRVLKLMVPVLFGVSVAQISLLIDNGFASFLPAGSISWLYYSDRLTYLPLGVIGVALASVVLPQLSRDHANASTENYSKTLDWALRVLLIIGVPATIGLATLAGPILATLLYHGHFNTHALYMTERSLTAYSTGLLGFMAIKILASSFYAKQNVKTPVKVAACTLVLNILLNFILIVPLAHAGLALATALSSFFNAALLLTLLKKQAIYQPKKGWTIFLARIIFAGILMFAALFYFNGKLNLWIEWTTITRIWHLVLLLIIGLTVYFAGLRLSGMRFKNMIRS